jgi:excisionase family DNA binding protein
MKTNDNNGCSVQRTYNAKEVAEILGVSLRTAYNLCETTNEFKVLRMGKRCLRIHKESFDKWFNSAQDPQP